MSRRVLITGGAGFVGQWLCQAMLRDGWTISVGSLEGCAPPTSVALSAAERAAIRWVALDVSSEDSMRAALDVATPDAVVHLAGIAFAPEANASPVRAFEVNALGVMRLFSVLGDARATAVKTLVIGSAEEYGAQQASAYPIKETAHLNPLTPYASSKATQELIALQYHRGAGVPVICTRSFNHSGVGHGSSYLLPSLVTRVCALPKRGGSLRIGNGTVIRDYLHVLDVIDAYLALLERGVPGEVYNVCSGEGTPVRALAERVLNRAGVSADITTDSSLLRPIDVPILVGDNSKLRAATGWAPKRGIDDIIDDLIHAASR